MTDASARRTLTLPRGADEDEGHLAETVETDLLEVRLPSRNFQIAYKVADSERFSLTAEFLLRLLKPIGALEEDDVAAFFGFSVDEARYVINAAEHLGHVTRSASGVRLTEAGEALFEHGDDKPYLYEVTADEERVGFDLISCEPIDYPQIDDFERELPELTVLPELASNATSQVKRAFRRHFRRLQLKRGGKRADRHVPYTIDDVQPRNRFSSLVPITIALRRDGQGVPEANLRAWRRDMDDPQAIAHACTDMVATIRVAPGYADVAAFRLASCAPEQVGRFARKGTVFQAEGYFRLTIAMAGEVRVDRPTVRVVGSLWTDKNSERLAVAARYAAQRGAVPAPGTKLLWLKPNLRYWGCTSRMPDVANLIAAEFNRSWPDAVPWRPETVVVGNFAECARRFGFAFDAGVSLDGATPDGTEQGLEVLLVPHRLACIVVHAPLSEKGGYPVPMGVISFAAPVIAQAHALLADVLTASFPRAEWPHGGQGLVAKILEDLESPPPSWADDRVVETGSIAAVVVTGQER